jgi:hypothetical protein
MNEVAPFAPDLLTRTADAVGRVLGVFTSGEHFLFLLLAIIPVAAWLYLFWRREPENKLLAVVTFIAGMLSVIPIFIFQQEIGHIESWIVSVGATAFVIIFLKSVWVGVYEETAKHWVVRHTDRKFFRNIDDAIEFSIIAALGFAFIENVLYFHTIWNNPLTQDGFAFYYIFRSLGSMFLHVFASGIFGYYYGIAHFAQPVLQEQLSNGKRFPLIGWLHQILHLKSETLFHEEKITEGLIIAAGLHGVFDLLMSLSQHYSEAGSDILGKVWLALAVPYLIGGYFWLTYLLDKKEDHKEYGHVTEERTSESESDRIIDPEIKLAIDRPAMISVACVISFFGAGVYLLMFPFAIKTAIQAGESLSLIAITMSSTIGLAAAIGLWNMKKWGLKIYIAIALLGLLLNLSQISIFFILLFIFEAAVIYTGYKHYDEMT